MKKFKLISLIFSLTTILSSHSLAMQNNNQKIFLDTQNNILNYNPNDNQNNNLANQINTYDIENNDLMNTTQNSQQDITNSEFSDKENKHLTIQETLELLDKFEDDNQNPIYIPHKQKKLQIYKKNRIKDINITINPKNSITNKLKNIDSQKRVHNFLDKMGQFISDKERKLNDKKIFSKKTLPKYDFKANKDTINKLENINSHVIKKNRIKNINIAIKLNEGIINNLKNIDSQKRVHNFPDKMGQFVSNKKRKLNNKKIFSKKTLPKYDFKANKDTINKLGNINSHVIKKNRIKNINIAIKLNEGIVNNLKNINNKKEVLNLPYKMRQFVSNKKRKLNNKKTLSKKTLSEYNFKSNKDTISKLKKYKQLIIKMQPIMLKKNTGKIDFGF